MLLSLVAARTSTAEAEARDNLADYLDDAMAFDAALGLPINKLDALGIAWRPPFRFALGKSETPGNNALEVTTINSWCKRVMADDKLRENKLASQTHIQVE